MITARALAADIERGRSLGVSEYVLKPFQPLNVVRRVKSMLAPVAT
jgi:DNA-binding response OmpR family regulator